MLWQIYFISYQDFFWTMCNADVHEKELKKNFFLLQRICKTKSWKTEQLLNLSYCSTGMCDDRGVWVGVHHPHLVSRMLLSLQRMAGTPTLRPQAFLCYRWVFFLFSVFSILHYLILISSRLISYCCQPARSQMVPRHAGLLLTFSVRSHKSAAHLLFNRLDAELCKL